MRISTALSLLLVTPCLSKATSRHLRTSNNKKHKKHTAIQSRIVDGVIAGNDTFPFFVTGSGTEIDCGASLIGPDVVLSAAHCAGAFDSVRIGVHNLDEPTDGVIRQVVFQMKHPEYDDWTLKNDIMLLFLESPAVNATVVPYARDEPLLDGEVLSVIGFGATSEDDSFGSRQLLEANVESVADSGCVDAYGSEVTIPVMFCAGNDNDNKDTCQGDSGGPIVDSNGVQVGVTSWGFGCGKPDYPGVYTRLSAYTEWINENICRYSVEPDTDLDCSNITAVSIDSILLEGGISMGSNDTAGNSSFVYDDDYVEASLNDGYLGDAWTVTLEVELDAFPEETYFYVEESGGRGQRTLEGPKSVMWDVNWKESFVAYSYGKYRLTILDSYGDGFNGSFALSTTLNGQKVVLASGPSQSFGSFFSVEFSMPLE